MTRDDKIIALKKWENTYQVCVEITNSIEKLFGDISESTLGTMLWQVYLTVTDLTALAIADEDSEVPLESVCNWLDWYCWENTMGRGGLTAGSFIAMSSVDTVEDLLNLIEGNGKYAS